MLAGCTDVVESNYATITEAKPDMERGWIPTILPPSTVQIRETHNLDTNIGHGTFSFGALDADQFYSALTALPVGEVIPKFTISRAKMEREGYSFYSHEGFYLAVDWKRRRGEFWSAYSH